METKNTHAPVCPHCGHVERDAWEINFDGVLEGDTTHSCASCGEDYFLSREITVTYSSVRINEAERGE